MNTALNEVRRKDVDFISGIECRLSKKRVAARSALDAALKEVAAAWRAHVAATEAANIIAHIPFKDRTHAEYELHRERWRKKDEAEHALHAASVKVAELAAAVEAVA